MGARIETNTSCVSETPCSNRYTGNRRNPPHGPWMTVDPKHVNVSKLGMVASPKRRQKQHLDRRSPQIVYLQNPWLLNRIICRTLGCSLGSSAAQPGLSHCLQGTSFLSLGGCDLTISATLMVSRLIFGLLRVHQRHLEEVPMAVLNILEITRGVFAQVHLPYSW